MIKDFVLRMKNADIIPELSFVLGMPAKTEKEVYDQILWDINFIKEIKQRGKARNSDHYWFSEKGVPCFFIYTLGGIKAYHDVFDIEKTLPLTGYTNVFRLLTGFVKVQ